MSNCKYQKPDGRRGELANSGYWISLTEGKERGGNEEWWRTPGVGGRVAPIRQYDPSGPPNRPVWLFDDGDMYLGEWGVADNGKGHPVEEGFGVCYNRRPDKLRGLVCVSEWFQGCVHGMGRSCWQENSYTWRKNNLPAGVIRQASPTKPSQTVGLPFNYTGRFMHDVKEDPAAIVTLKDGTTRVGPWVNGLPEGDWWTDHQSAAAVAPAPMPSIQAPAGQSRVASPPQPRRSSRDAETANRQNKRSRTSSRASRSESGACLKHDSDSSVRNDVANDGNVIEESPPQQPAKPSRQKPSNIRVKREDDNSGANNSVITIFSSDEEPQQVDSDEEDKLALQELQDWLTTVIGYNPRRKEMKAYARQFLDLGLHSVVMIQDVCKEVDVDGFAWMKPFHKREFLKNANLKN